jgi:hypothetical protein
MNEKTQILEKDTVDLDAAPAYIYRDGPWSMCVDEVISAVIQGGSKLMQWIPTRGVKTRNEHVAHLSWIAPEGFTGETSYIDYLGDLDTIAQCDFGPSSDWQGVEYRHSSYRVSFQSPLITRRDFGELECERSPIYMLRGPGAGRPIDNDADWALARVAFQFEQHLNWNLIFGDPTAGQLMYDGLDVIIDTGWVAAHAVGNGSTEFTDPVIINGTGLTSPSTVLRAVKGMVRRIRQRASDRGVRLTPSDYALVMPRAIWSYLADAIAMGAMIGAPVANINIQMDAQSWFSERARITAGFFGDGFIEVDGQPVPVITDDIMGANVTLPNGRFGVTGDIYLLTRRFGPVNILEHQYLDWNQIPPRGGVPINEVIMQNGMLRTGWKEYNNTCFQYFAEMEARLMCKFMPLQGKITDVTVETLLENENEVGSFAAQDFYAFGGQRGGQGNVLILGRNA